MSFYRFWPRQVGGVYANAWRLHGQGVADKAWGRSFMLVAHLGPAAACAALVALFGRDVQPALIGRQYVTERNSAPVQYNDIL